MKKRRDKDIAAKEKMLSGTGLLFAVDGKQFITAVDYRIRTKTFGEVREWGGTVSVLNGLTMDVEYILELEQEDERTGRIKLELFKEKRQKGLIVYEYTFKGITPLK